MRLFIAIEVSEEIHTYFLELQKQIDTGLTKNVLARSFHLTLKFFGDVDEDKKNKIIELLRKIKFKLFSVELGNIGVFPDESYIKVIWVGLEPKDKINDLQQKIDQVLVGLFPKDKRFHPHITLARVKFVKDKEEFVKSLKGIRVDKKSFEVNCFRLIKSTLTPKGPVYEVLEEFNSVK